ncbi:7120_t:CDS:1, partial [Gigaspora margarita]
ISLLMPFYFGCRSPLINALIINNVQTYINNKETAFFDNHLTLDEDNTSVRETQNLTHNNWDIQDTLFLKVQNPAYKIMSPVMMNLT